MSNTCHNAIIVKGPASKHDLSNIEAMVGGHYLKEHEHFQIEDNGDHVMYFNTAWSPPRKETQIAQDAFKHLSIEHYFDEPMMNLFGRALPDGRLREDVKYEYPQCEWHELGYRIWDRTGKKLLEDHSKPVPRYLRLQQWYWITKANIRERFRLAALGPNPAYDDDFPF